MGEFKYFYVILILLLIFVGRTIYKSKSPFIYYFMNILNLILILIYYISSDYDSESFIEFIFLYIIPILIFLIGSLSIYKNVIRNSYFYIFNKGKLFDSSFIMDEILESVKYLKERKIGALITIENEMSLDQFVKESYVLDAHLSSALLSNIFTPTAPLHDGGVIIKGDKLKSASAYYQPTTRKDIPKTLGSRHRAGIGISEQSDSLTIIISEETGMISLANQGYLERNLSLKSLGAHLERFYNKL
jgi:diadenylate cyclase